jgi:hypothetical protein
MCLSYLGPYLCYNTYRHQNWAEHTQKKLYIKLNQPPVEGRDYSLTHQQLRLDQIPIHLFGRNTIPPEWQRRTEVHRTVLVVSYTDNGRDLTWS